MVKETAEQKLLKALQKKSGTSSSSGTKQADANKKFQISLSIFDLNKILLLVIIGCVLVLIYQIRSGTILLKKEVNFSEQTKTIKRQESGLPQVKDVKFYIDSFGNRNIFKPYDISLGKAAVGQPNLGKRLSKYKLVGVAWFDVPESTSIMVEDSTSKITYFLKTGEKLEGVTVKTIYTDRVVFSYENEETTIKL